MAGSSAAFDLSAVLKLDANKLSAGLNAAATQFTSFAARASSAINGLATRMQGLVVNFDKIAQAAVRSGQVIGRGLDTATKAATGLATATGLAATAMTKLASDANEAASKFGFVFGGAAEKTGKSLDEFAKAAGRSRYELRSMAADVGALLNPMGFTKEKTGELSVALAKLTTDLSSFFNVSESDALIALRAAIVGEAEPMRRLGVTINEAKIQQEALTLGLVKNKKEIDSRIKAQAILSIVFNETQQAQGDAIRTGDQLANSWRRMTSFIKDAATDLGQVFVPVVTKYVRAAGDAAVKAAEWAKANQGLLTQKLDSFLSKVESAASKLGKAFVSVWKNSGPIVDVFQGIYDKAVQLYQGFMAWFETLPKGTQDALKVAAAATAIGIGLEKIGGSIPVVGQFVSALGSLINPVNAVQGAFSALLPLIGAGGSVVAAFISSGAGLAAAIISFIAATGPLGLLIAALVGAGGLAAAITSGTLPSIENLGDELKGRLASGFETAKSAAAGFFALLKGDGQASLGNFKIAAGHIADMLGLKGTGAQLKAEGEAAVQEANLKPKLRAKRVRKYGEAGADLQERTQASKKTLDEHLADLKSRGLTEATDPMGRAALLRRMYEHDLAKEKAQLPALEKTQSARRAVGVGAAGLVSGGVRKAGGFLGSLGKRLGGFANDIQSGFDEQKNTNLGEGRERLSNRLVFAKRQGSFGGMLGYAAGLIPDVVNGVTGINATAAQQAAEKAAAEKVAAEQALAERRANSPRGQTNAFLFGNLLNEKSSRSDIFQSMGIFGGQQNTAFAGVRKAFKDNGTTNMQELGQRQQAMQSLQQFGMQIMQRMQAVENLSEEERKVEIENIKKAQQELFKFTDGLQKGTINVKGLAGEVAKAAQSVKKMTEADEEKALNAQGKLSPRQQQAQQQAHQAAQQMAQGIQQALGMANEQSKAIWQGVFGGAEQVQQMIDQAVATGNTKAATELIRGRIEAQLQQSKQNLHLLGTSTFTGNFNADNSAFQMTKDTPIVNLIKFLENQLAHLPHMASGGIVTGATNIVAGEAGPEAILPLSKFGNMLGALPVFQGIQNAVERIGNYFNSVGNTGMANQYFANLSKVQHTYDYAMDRLWNSRGVNFTPASMGGIPGMGNSYGYASAGMGGRMAYGAGSMPFGVGGYAGNMMGIGAVHLNFHGVDISAPGAAVAFAQKLFPALDAEAKRAGYSMMGGSRLRSGGMATSNRAYGYSR